MASCAIYGLSLIACYGASTLYHSFFLLPPRQRYVLEVLDHCAIYLLIAGCYSPFLTFLFHGAKPQWAIALQALLWAIAAVGVAFSAGFHGAPAVKTPVEVTLYLSMGWAIMLCVGDVRAAIDPRGWRGLLHGGIAYTLGVPWFLRGADYGGADHVIWHLFVLLGSALHYNAILRYLVWAPPVVP